MRRIQHELHTRMIADGCSFGECRNNRLKMEEVAPSHGSTQSAPEPKTVAHRTWS
jgi:hypothetical protein